MKNKAYIPAAILLLSSLVLHFAGMKWHFYVIWTWYDNPLHFITGLGLGFFFYWAFASFPFLGGPLSGRHLWAIVGLTLIAAIVWECFEALYDLAGYATGSLAYIADTSKDILNGVLGSVTALVIVWETYERNKKA